MIKVVPALRAVTCPEEFTVATAVFDETQGLEAAAVPDPLSGDESPTQAFGVPVMLHANGSPFA